MARVTSVAGTKKTVPVQMLTPTNASALNRKVLPKFTIQERYQFLRQMVTMVGQGLSYAAIVSGEGGTGKSYQVLETLKALGLKENTDYIVVKGNSSSKGLFETLSRNLMKIIVFDDCDSIFSDSISTNLLKGALDSHGIRKVCWNNGDALESISFQGSIIFITNVKLEKLDQAILSRCMTVDVSMTKDEKIAYMQDILHVLRPEISVDVKQSALDFISEYKDTMERLTLRTFLKVMACAATEDPNWRRLALYSLD